MRKSNGRKTSKLINIALLEKFSYQSDIAIGKYKLNLNSKEISKNNITIDLTERDELDTFFKAKINPVKIDELQKKFGNMVLI